MSLVGGFTAISEVGQRAGPYSRSFAGGCRGEGRRLQTSCTARTSSSSRRSMQPPDASLTFPCPLVAANDDEASLWVTLRQAHIEHFLAGVSQKVAKLLHCSERRVRAKGSGVMMSAAWALPVRLRNSSRTRDRGFVLRSDSCDHRSNGLRIRRSLDRKGFSSWRGSDDKLWGERDPGLDRTCDKAMGFDAVHGFA